MDLLKRFAGQFNLQPASSQIVNKPRQFTLKEVAHHCTVNDCWMVIMDKVYDLTDFIDYHPAGQELMLEYAGTDATSAFNEKPHTIDAVYMLDKYLIGELVKQDRMFT